MIKAVGRSVLAIVLGFLGASVFIMASQQILVMIHPPPQGVYEFDEQVTNEYYKNLSVLELVLLLVGYLLGTFAGAGLAARITSWGRLAHGLIIGALLLSYDISFMNRFEHPRWFWIVSIALLLPTAYAGAQFVILGRPAPTSEPGTPP